MAAGYVESGTDQYLGIFLSTNGGTNWTQVKIMNENGTEATAVALAPSDVNTIYVAGCDSSQNKFYFYRSTNGGAAWTQATAPPTSPWSYVNSLAVHPGSATTVYATSQDGIYKSTDGGSSWTKLDKAPSGGNCLAVNPANPNGVFVGDSEGIQYSADGGATWADLSAGLAAKNVVWIEIDGPGRQVYAGIESGGICRRSF